MKAIYFFYTAAFIDILALLIAIYFILTDMAYSIGGGTNNPSMYRVLAIMILLVGAAFWLKSIGKIVFANILLWVPAFPLFCYGLMVLLFVVFKPDMR
jgi:hypothetical protein